MTPGIYFGGNAEDLNTGEDRYHMKYISLDKIPPEGVSHEPGISKKVIIGDNELAHLRKFSQAIFTTGQIANMHVHDDFHEVFFIESGEGTIQVKDQKVTVMAGDCVVAEATEEHEIVNTGPSDLVITYFGLET